MDENVKLAAQTTTELTQKISTIQSEIINAIDCNGHDMQDVSAKGEALLSRIEADGMNDEVDADTAAFIKDAKNTAKQMNERRKVVTQVFDKIRKGFTLMESVVDIKSADSVIFKLQQKRDNYAAWKLEQQRKAEAERQRLARIEEQKVALANHVQGLCGELAHQCTVDGVAHLHQIFAGLTLDNVEETRKRIANYTRDTVLEVELLKYNFAEFSELDSRTRSEIANDARIRCAYQYEEANRQAIEEAKQELLDRFDSKVAELEEIARAEEERRKLEEAAAKAAAEERVKLEAEAAKRRAEEEQRRAELAAAEEEQRREQERKLEEQRKLQEEQARIAQADAQMQAMFEQKEYISDPVKAKVTKSIQVNDPSAFADIIQMWWSHVGSQLSVAELTKKLGFMVKACEKLANDSDIVITNNNVLYVENVSAK